MDRLSYSLAGTYRWFTARGCGGGCGYTATMEQQIQPLAGDTVSSDNDSPPAPGESITHIHRTFHFQGNEAALNRISTKTLQVSVVDAQDALKSR